MNYQNTFSRAIDRLKSDVTIKVNTKTFNQYGDETVTSTSVSTVAVVNAIQGNEEWNKDGLFVSKDKIFFFKGDRTDLDVGNYITLNSQDYEIIQEPIEHEIENVIQYIEVRAKRI